MSNQHLKTSLLICVLLLCSSVVHCQDGDGGEDENADSEAGELRPPPPPPPVLETITKAVPDIEAGGMVVNSFEIPLTADNQSNSQRQPTVAAPIAVTSTAPSIDVNVTYLSKLHSRLLTSLNAGGGGGGGGENGGEEEACELDAILDSIIPPSYEVARNFNLSSHRRVGHIRETLAIFDNIIKLGASYRQTFAPLIQKLVTRFSFLAYEIQLSPACLQSVLAISQGLQKNEFWAFKYLDASGRIPNGIIEGVLSSVGDYDECLNIEHRLPKAGDKSAKTVRGKFCFAKPLIPYPARGSFQQGDQLNSTFGIPATLVDEMIDVLAFLEGSTFNIGLCIPSTCSAGEIENAINMVLYPITNIPVQVGPNCQTKPEPTAMSWLGWFASLNFHQKMSICVFASLFALSIVASMYEGYVAPRPEDILATRSKQTETTPAAAAADIPVVSINMKLDANGNHPKSIEKKPAPRLSLPSRCLISFSLVGNTRSMFKVSPAKFAVIDFWRFVMLLEIILMHQYYVALGWSAWPLTKRFVNGLLQQAGTEPRYAFLRNIHNTDFFFALTGLLLTYSSLRSLERTRGRFNYLQFAVNMYLRFYPAVFGTILMYYLLPLFGDGPFWHLVDKYHVETCRTNLAANLLSYNFYVLDIDSFVQSSMCNIGSWWVTSCFHLMLLSPLIFLPLYYSSRSIVLAVAAIVLGCALSVGHIVYKGIPFMNEVSLMNSITEESFYSIFYTWPFIHHIGPFVLGMLFGYLIRRFPNLPLGGRIGETVLGVVFVGLSAVGFQWTQAMLKSKAASGDFANFIVSGQPSTSRLEIYLNITIGKLMFVIGFLWLFYYCCTRPKSWLNSFFTWPCLQPLYSISLGLYLANFLPILFTTFTTHTVIEFTDFLIIKNYTFNLTLTIGLAYILHVLFEKPVMNLLKIVESG